MNSFNQFGFISDEVATALGENYTQSFSSESYSSYSTITTKNPSNTASSGLDSVKDSQASFEKPPKQLKICSATIGHVLAKPSYSSSPSSQLLSFGNSNSPPAKPQQKGLYDKFNSPFKPKQEHFPSLVTKDSEDDDFRPTSIKGTKRSYSSVTRTPAHAQVHIMAERKRREKLSQRFIALSAIVPGLKKVYTIFNSIYSQFFSNFISIIIG